MCRVHDKCWRTEYGDKWTWLQHVAAAQCIKSVTDKSSTSFDAHIKPPNGRKCTLNYFGPSQMKFKRTTTLCMNYASSAFSTTLPLTWNSPLSLRKFRMSSNILKSFYIYIRESILTICIAALVLEQHTLNYRDWSESPKPCLRGASFPPGHLHQVLCEEMEYSHCYHQTNGITALDSFTLTNKITTNTTNSIIHLITCIYTGLLMMHSTDSLWLSLYFMCSISHSDTFGLHTMFALYKKITQYFLLSLWRHSLFTVYYCFPCLL